MSKYQSYLFNFSASYFGGGLKRIRAYIQWFNANGGANFVLNKRLQGIETQYPNNRYCFIQQNSLAKVLNYSRELKQFIAEFKEIDFYYSYNVPLNYKIGKVNWIHIANVLPFVNPSHYVGIKRAMELRLLGFLLKNSMKYADIISAESKASIALVKHRPQAKKVVSVNGSDDEIAAYNPIQLTGIENIAVAVGTCYYKKMDDVYTIYQHLRQSNPELRLLIAGIEKDVPNYVRRDKQVFLCGVLSQLEVCELLKKAKYYITATLIENSYNAASEGIFFAKESYISDIGPHRELLENIKHRKIKIGSKINSLHVICNDLNLNNLKSWDQIIKEMIQEKVKVTG